MVELVFYNIVFLVGLLVYLIEGYNDDGVNYGVVGIF